MLKKHRALLSLPEMLNEHAALQEWEAMAHNVAAARAGIGQQVSSRVARFPCFFKKISHLLFSILCSHNTRVWAGGCRFVFSFLPQDAPVFLKVLSACEEKVASVLQQHRSESAGDAASRSATMSAGPVDSPSAGGSAGDGSLSLNAQSATPERGGGGGGRMSRWKRILHAATSVKQEAPP